MNIICSILVVVAMGGGVNVSSPATLTGKVITESETNYLGDFSEATDIYSDLIGDYSQVLVEKNKCIKLKGSK